MKRICYLFFIMFPIIVPGQTGLNINGGYIKTNSGAYVNITKPGGGITINNNGKMTNEGTLTVEGNWVNNASYFSAGGRVVFSGAGSVVNGNSTTEFCNLTIRKGAETDHISLKTGFGLKGHLVMDRGDIYLNNQNINLGLSGEIVGESNANRIFDDPATGTGKILVSRNSLCPSAGETFGNIGLLIISDNCCGNTTVARCHKSQISSFSGNQSIARYFEITTDSAAINATLQFYYFDEEVPSGMTEENFALYRSTDNGVTWGELLCDADAANNVLRKTDVFPVGRFTVSDLVSQPLPVEIIEFNATVSGKDVLLSWLTLSETNFLGFEIERSDNLIQWEKVGFVAGAGFSNTRLPYSYVDPKPFNGTLQLYYRLKVLNIDRTFSFTEIKPVSVDDQGMPIISLFPNPAENHVAFSGLKSDETLVLRVFSSSGLLILNQDITNETIIDCSEWLPGVYCFSISKPGDISILNQRIIKL